MAKKHDFQDETPLEPIVEAPGDEPAADEPAPAKKPAKKPAKSAAQRFHVTVRHCPLPKKLRSMVVEAADEDSAWAEFVERASVAVGQNLDEAYFTGSHRSVVAAK